MSSSTEESPFAFLGGRLCLDFANTAFREDGAVVWELLDGYDDLLAWGRAADVLTAAEAERLRAISNEQGGEARVAFGRAVELRERIYRLFAAVAEGQAVEREDLEGLNDSLAEAYASRRLVAEGGAFRWEWRGGDAALDPVLWPVAGSAGELLTAAELGRVRRCAGEDCTRLFLDTSRNGRRRWCDMSHCGNIAKVRRFRSRHGVRAQPSGR